MSALDLNTTFDRVDVDGAPGIDVALVLAVSEVRVARTPNSLPGTYTVTVRALVADRDSGRLSGVTYEREGTESLVVQVRETLREIAMHEVDEQLRSKGIRIFDPHAGDETECAHARRPL